MSIIINRDGDNAFDSKEFSYAYIHKFDLGSSTCLKVILKNEKEIWWDSSPGMCCYAEKDVKEFLSKLVLQLSDIPVVVSQDGKQAFNVNEFCCMRRQNFKEGYTSCLTVTLRNVDNIRWFEIGYDDGSEDVIKNELYEFADQLEKISNQHTAGG